MQIRSSRLYFTQESERPPRPSVGLSAFLLTNPNMLTMTQNSNQPPHEDALPTSQSGLDAYLSEMMEETARRKDQRETDDENPASSRNSTDDPIVNELDDDKTLTLYGAMLVAVTAATDALRDKDLAPHAESFFHYLSDLRTDLYQ